MFRSPYRMIIPIFLLPYLFAALSFGADAVPADPVENVGENSTQPWKEMPAVVPGEVELVHADGFGGFLVIGRNKNPKDSRQIWSLKDQKVVGTIVGKYEVEKPWTLSPDGKYLAGWRGFFAGNNIAVFDTVKGKPYAELKNPGKVDDLHFLANGKLAASSPEGIVFWDIAKKKMISAVPLGKRGPFDPKPVLSPNGKVIAALTKKVVTLYDETGKELASYTPPKLDGTFGGDIVGAAYHPDGRTLAIYLHSVRKQGFALLDTVKGEFKGPFEVEDATGHIQPGERVIDWSLDGRALVLRNRHVADPESGKTLWKFPEAEGGIRAVPTAARLFSPSQGIYPTESGSKYVVKAITHDADKIETMVKAARSGVKITDAALPKLTETTLNGVPSATWPATSVAWSGKSDPAGDASKVTRVPLRLDSKADHVDQIFFTPLSAGLVFIGIRPEGFAPPVMPGQQDKSKSRAVDVYKIADGLKVGRVDLAFSAKFRTASLDGKFIVVSDSETGERLDVLNVEKGEPVCGFRPFHQEGTQGKRPTFIRFVGDGRLLTGNGSRYVVWNVPACTATAQLTVKPHSAVLSPNAKLLAIAEGDSLRVLDAGTLTIAGDLNLPEMNAFIKREVLDIVFHPDGKSLAIAYQLTGKDGSSEAVIANWDLQTGKAGPTATVRGRYLAHFGMPSLEFAGKDHFLLNHMYLISSAKNDVIWTFQANAFQAKHAAGSPDGRHWMTMRAEPLKESAALVPSEILDPRILEWVKIIETAPTVLWKPGTTVLPSVQIGGDGAANAQKALEATLTAQGMKIGSGNATLTVTASESPTGKTVKYRDIHSGFGGAMGDQSIAETAVNGVAQLAINGTVIWQGNASFVNTRHFVSLPKDADLGSYLNKAMWSAAAGWAGSVTPPKLIVQTRDGNLALPGVATFTAKGLEVLPPIVRVGK